MQHRGLLQRDQRAVALGVRHDDRPRGGGVPRPAISRLGAGAPPALVERSGARLSRLPGRGREPPAAARPRAAGPAARDPLSVLGTGARRAWALPALRRRLRRGLPALAPL